MCIDLTMQALEEFFCLTMHPSFIDKPKDIERLSSKEHILSNVEVWNHIQFLMDDCYTLLLCIGDRLKMLYLAFDQHFALIVGIDTRKDVHQGGFACTILSYQRIDLPRHDAKIHAVEGQNAGEALGDVAGFEVGMIHCSSKI